jgi:hypothetical protein
LAVLTTQSLSLVKAANRKSARRERGLYTDSNNQHAEEKEKEFPNS